MERPADQGLAHALRRNDQGAIGEDLEPGTCAMNALWL